ncbi:type II toxin-antitoxin system VapC family toxin [Marinibaculum pumilum]|uniref:Type II toxin-antitoxin system VapC family toxin n=1 Tax=Marinibaculum pumilum TaxID=1766165 RepID=A0ABV7KWW8_9PROT
MLDTNTVSHLIRQHPRVTGRVTALSPQAMCISAITEAELHFGLARHGGARMLRDLVTAFLRTVESLVWNSSAAQVYGSLRARLQRSGEPLASLDMLIAAHASATGCVLVTNDKAFRRVPDLQVEDWTLPA